METESTIGVLTNGPNVVFNSTTYSKIELAPDTDYLGTYSVYDSDSMTYIKLSIREGDHLEFC